MFSRMLIRNKILYSTMLLTATLLLLLYCSMRGVGAYRNLAIDMPKLATEFKQLWQLKDQVVELRDKLNQYADAPFSLQPRKQRSVKAIEFEFLSELHIARAAFLEHRERIHALTNTSDPLLTATKREVASIDRILVMLDAVEDDMSDLSADPTQRIDDKLAQILSEDMRQLFNSLTGRMDSFRNEIRLRYRSLQFFIVFSALASLFNVIISFWFFRRSVVQPFKVLLGGSREIASGKFEYRIRLDSKDELAELAEAMNDMSDRFVQIRNNLNEQVQQRTQEVVRSEQLASVGFLAAGVAHEINNPLASIAWSAEALESRLHEILHQPEHTSQEQRSPTEYDPEQLDILRDYLKRIQEEAFRCKGITERLLDFSRLGESQQKQETDIHQAVQDVIELVRHLGQYRNRHVVFHGTPGIYAMVSPTEFKQIVLNLLTNALDASSDGDSVQVELDPGVDCFVLRVVDQGCGMTEEVRKNLFEPFFTRRRDGRGTGLGLSITYRIVQDHAGTLVPSSAGPGQGSTMVLTFPLSSTESGSYEGRKAA